MLRNKRHFRAWRGGLSFSGMILTFLFLTTQSSIAQVNQGPCDTCYKNYVYNNDFIIGGHNVPLIDEFHDLFTLEFSQHYTGSGWEDLARLDTTVYIYWKADINHPWGGVWQPDPVLAQVGSDIDDTTKYLGLGLRKMTLEKALARGMKLIYHPNYIPEMTKEGGNIRESYYVQPYGFQPFRFLQNPNSVSGTDSAKRANLHALTGGFYWSYTVPASVTPDTVFMAGRPDYLDAAARAEKAYLYDSAGVPRKLEWLSIGFALNTKVDSLNDEEIPDSAVIAYADVYVRDILGQESCRCHIMKPFTRIEITKEWFLDVVDKGRDLQAINDNGAVYYDIDTLIDFSSVWDNVTTGLHWPEEGVMKTFYHENGDTLLLEGSVWCDSLLLQRLRLPASDSLHLPPGSWKDPQYADASKGLTFRFYTTRIVPISFLRSRVATPHFINVREGVYDSLIRYAVNGVYADSRIDSLVGRIGVGDESGTATMRVQAIMSSKVQRFMAEHPIGKDRPKPLWHNPAHGFDEFRLYMGDFDSTEYRPIHMAARQQYRFNSGDPIPMYYGNLDSMSAKARDTMFKFLEEDRRRWDYHRNTNGYRWDTARHRVIVGTHRDDYLYYRECIQEGSLGRYKDKDSINAFLHSPLVKGVSKLSDVFRESYADRFPHIPKTPVWNVVQTHGFVPHNAYKDGNKDFIGFGGSRIVTPEEIAVQAWLSMNCGANGMVFGDLQLDGATFGLGSFWMDSSKREMNYGRLRQTNYSERADEFPNKYVEDMWLGLGDRRAAMLETIKELRYIDTVVGWKYLVENRQQMTVFDTVQSFDELLFVEEVRTERAKQHDYSIDSLGVWTFNGSDTFDVREETFMEATVFRADPSSIHGTVEGERFLLLTNRLTWPVDTLTYSSASVTLFNTTHTWFPTDSVGLGAIDVRRPVVILTNNTDYLADSVEIERIASSGSWTDTVAFGDTITLDWQLPGRGAMYRLRPLLSLIGKYGTAYNNAVRSENPSKPNSAKDRLLVYERDSVIYMRTVDSTGHWSREEMISDPDDTVLVSGQRTASNFFPSLAVSRGGSGFTRLIWERDSAGYRSVETLLFPVSGVSGGNVTYYLDNDLVHRQRIENAGSWTASWAMTPAIVAVDDASGVAGYVISWADETKGVNVSLLREIPDWTNKELIRNSDSVSVRQVRSIGYSTEVSQYPTLANVKQEAIVSFGTNNQFGIAGLTPPIIPVEQLPTELQNLQSPAKVTQVHLAYQQGDGLDGEGERIYYHPLGVTFGATASAQPGLWVGLDEEVSKKISACSFEHPSIATDSLRVGVAFEVLEGNGQQTSVGLRFRDTVGVNGFTGQPLQSWETYLYRWVNTIERRPLLGTWQSDCIRPSLTHFPSMDSTTLWDQAEGGLTWYNVDGPESRYYPQMLYRYGWEVPRDVGDGKDPSMTLVPLIEEDPFEQTSIFHRAGDSSNVRALNNEGDTVDHYPARFINSPGNPFETVFASLPGSHGIVATGKGSYGYRDCDILSPVDHFFEWGLVFEGTHHSGDDDRHVTGDPPNPTTEPGLPPRFFERPIDGKTIISDEADAQEVVRTSVFTAGSSPVYVRRLATAGDSLTSYFDTFAWDTERNVAANVWTVLELVRASDSVVLWRGDTISARTISTQGSTVDGTVEIPSHISTTEGELLWVQMRCFKSSSILSDIQSGFTFYNIDGSTPSQKRSSPWQREEIDLTVETSASLSLHVVPNPATDRAEVQVFIQEEGTVEVSVWSVLGEPLAVLPTIVSAGSETYSEVAKLIGTGS